jgi:hypothetical protein
MKNMVAPTFRSARAELKLSATTRHQPARRLVMCGRVAQLGERGVRNAEVVGSNPFASTKRPHSILFLV